MKLIKGIAAALLLVWTFSAPAVVTTVLSAVVTTGASSAVDTAQAKAVYVHVYSATTSTCTVKIQQSLDNAIWYDSVAAITDPSATGELWSVASAPYTRVNVTARTGGTITAKIDVER